MQARRKVEHGGKPRRRSHRLDGDDESVAPISPPVHRAVACSPDRESAVDHCIALLRISLAEGSLLERSGIREGYAE